MHITYSLTMIDVEISTSKLSHAICIVKP